MEIKIIVLLVCTACLVAIAIITALSENRKRRVLTSLGMPVILAVNTFFPPMYVAAEYFAAIAMCMVIQTATVFISTRWMRIAVGIMLAVVELILCILLTMFLYAYILHEAL